LKEKSAQGTTRGRALHFECWETGLAVVSSPPRRSRARELAANRATAKEKEKKRVRGLVRGGPPSVFSQKRFICLRWPTPQQGTKKREETRQGTLERQT